MKQKRHKIPILLKLVRAKYTKPFLWTDRLLRSIKRNKKYKGTIKKILFIRIDRIGDAVVTLPLLRDLKLNYPEIEIHLIASQKNYHLLKNTEYIDNLIEYKEDIPIEYHNTYKRFLFSKQILALLKKLFQSYYNNDENIISKLKNQKYDAVIDLTSDKRCVLLSKMISKYSAGGKIPLLSFLYKYQLDTSWVDIRDRNFLILKYENLLRESLGLNLIKRNKSLPFKQYNEIDITKEYDIVFHISSNPIRIFDTEKEETLINSLSNKKILITDFGKSDRYNYYQSKFKDNKNISFGFYERTEDIRQYLSKAKLFLTYDGGHSHYSSQFIKTIVIFTSTSPYLWKPYEFEDYKTVRKWENGTVAEKSTGKYGHIIIYSPIWCNPCFDIGCKSTPCIKSIEIKYINEILNQEL